MATLIALNETIYGIVQEGLPDSSVHRINGNVKFLWDHCDVFPAAEFSVFSMEVLADAKDHQIYLRDLAIYHKTHGSGLEWHEICNKVYFPADYVKPWLI
ncbi:unnamed protein product [Symbiodinium necroappetens]|uniref:Uncharacterized protein n=1 Tax=Symbiodinium necroappetens TaxID=1628268 RepID=A0A812TFS3_9DINO|nr:unnamed protein product [Symbiodinium necroappetens]